MCRAFLDFGVKPVANVTMIEGKVTDEMKADTADNGTCDCMEF